MAGRGWWSAGPGGDRNPRSRGKRALGGTPSLIRFSPLPQVRTRPWRLAPDYGSRLPLSHCYLTLLSHTVTDTHTQNTNTHTFIHTHKHLFLTRSLTHKHCLTRALDLSPSLSLPHFKSLAAGAWVRERLKPGPSSGQGTEASGPFRTSLTCLPQQGAHTLAVTRIGDMHWH